MTKPKRIQRKRTRGWKNPTNTIYVGRPTKWGNPFKIYRGKNDLYSVMVGETLIAGSISKNLAVNLAVALYKKQIIDFKMNLSELRGKNLSCFCSLNQPCHADVLLKFANG